MKILEANQDVRDQLVLGGDCKHKGNLDKDLGHSKKVNFAFLNLFTPDWHLHCKGRRQNLESLQSIFKHKLSHDYFKQGPAGGTEKGGRPGESHFMNKNYMSHLLLLGKFEYGGGPIFKVVLEC